MAHRLVCRSEQPRSSGPLPAEGRKATGWDALLKTFGEFLIAPQHVGLPVPLETFTMQCGIGDYYKSNILTLDDVNDIMTPYWGH